MMVTYPQSSNATIGEKQAGGLKATCGRQRRDEGGFEQIRFIKSEPKVRRFCSKRRAIVAFDFPASRSEGQARQAGLFPFF
jgi:hypothetical protein